MAWGAVVSANVAATASATENFAAPISALPREGVHLQVLVTTSPATVAQIGVYANPYGWSSAPAQAFDQRPVAFFGADTSASAFSMFLTGYRGYRVGGKTAGTGNDFRFQVRTRRDGAGVSGNA